MHALFPLLAFMKSDCYNNRSIWKLQELYFIPTITGDYNNEEIKPEVQILMHNIVRQNNIEKEIDKMINYMDNMNEKNTIKII